MMLVQPSAESENLEVISDKDKFYIELRKFYDNRVDGTTNPEWTKERVNAVINSIEQFNTASVLRQPKTQQQYRNSKKYDVMSVGEEKLLILRRQGGIQDNVIPEKFTAHFDLRLALSVNHTDFENMIKRWCEEAGAGVSYTFDQKENYVPPTKLDDSNPYWLAFKAAADELKLQLKVSTFPGGTDSRYLRELGVPAIGFSPMSCTTRALHETDESLRVQTFLDGITAYEGIVAKVANVA